MTTRSSGRAAIDAVRRQAGERQRRFGRLDRQFNRPPLRDLTKDEIRAELEGLVAEHLANGGTITRVPT